MEEYKLILNYFSSFLKSKMYLDYQTYYHFELFKKQEHVLCEEFDILITIIYTYEQTIKDKQYYNFIYYISMIYLKLKSQVPNFKLHKSFLYTLCINFCNSNLLDSYPKTDIYNIISCPEQQLEILNIINLELYTNSEIIIKLNYLFENEKYLIKLIELLCEEFHNKSSYYVIVFLTKIINNKLTKPIIIMAIDNKILEIIFENMFYYNNSYNSINSWNKKIINIFMGVYNNNESNNFNNCVLENISLPMYKKLPLFNDNLDKELLLRRLSVLKKNSIYYPLQMRNDIDRKLSLII